jgi:hypothetical protein
MGKTLGLISCTKSKKSYSCPAKELYQPSNLFRSAFDYCSKHYDYVAMLSAKYGLLLPDERIAPYDLTLKSMNEAEQKKWAERVFSQLSSKLPMSDISEVFLHAGLVYRVHLARLLEDQGIQCTVPLEGLSIGEQVAWYVKRQVSGTR